jgi:protein SCO1/2
VVFFYTRCDNPNKCSLTVTKLARLQKSIVEEQLEGLLRTAAITYDPAYDLPPRLKAYGDNRG